VSFGGRLAGNDSVYDSWNLYEIPRDTFFEGVLRAFSISAL
jgi:hypothetical protein